MELKKAIGLVTILLFIYNALFTYIIVNLTNGSSRTIFLLLLSLDYIIIFYFIIQVARELRFSKDGMKIVRKGKKG